MQLDGRRIVVTGGARGIGAAVVRAFVREGAAVVSMDLLEDEGAAAADEANQRGPGTVIHQTADVGNRESVEHAFAAAADHLGGLDVLFHAAGVQRSLPTLDMQDEDWDLVLDTNARSTMLTNQAAFGLMRGHGGRIINTGSAAGLIGMPETAHYAASKGAVMAWTRSVAHEWGRWRVTVNAIVPAIWTPMYQAWRDQQAPEDLEAHDDAQRRRIPLGGRMGDPDEDLAPVLVFLAGDGARFITGQLIAINGGADCVR